MIIATTVRGTEESNRANAGFHSANNLSGHVSPCSKFCRLGSCYSYKNRDYKSLFAFIKYFVPVGLPQDGAELDRRRAAFKTLLCMGLTPGSAPPGEPAPPPNPSLLPLAVMPPLTPRNLPVALFRSDGVVTSRLVAAT